MNEIRCSIIINTYNRAPYLEKLLASLQHLSYKLFEVIVVNGPSTDETEELLKKYEGRIKVVSCPKTNLSMSRNLGITAAAGDFVVFIDDDALPENSDWLSSFSKVYENDSECRIGAVGGPVLHRDTNYYEFHGGLTSEYAFQIFRVEESQDAYIKNQFWFRGTAGGNTSFRRQALEKIGGFDENFTYYLDESDVCLRLTKAGYEIVYDDQNAIRHYAARSDEKTKIFRNWKVITRSDTYFCMKNPSDPLFKRLFKTLLFSTRKHFFQETLQSFRNRYYNFSDLMFFLIQWLYGLGAGILWGIFKKSENNFLKSTSKTFLPFTYPFNKNKNAICLLSQKLPPDPKIGGNARHIFDLGKGLYEQGYEVHIFTQSEQPIRREGLKFFIHGISQKDYTRQELFPKMPILNKNVAYSLSLFSKFLDLSQSGIRFDTIYTTNWDLEALALIKAKICPVVLMLVTPLAKIIDTEGWEYNEDMQANIALDCWQIKNADALACPSFGVSKSYQEKMGLDILNELNSKKILLGICPRLGRKTVNPPNHTTPNILFVGRLEYRKGTHILLDVLPDLLKQYPDWRCDFVGEDGIIVESKTTLKETFCKEYAATPWFKRISFHGTVSDERLQEFYRNCTIFVAPSLYESFGLIYLEAMQYGKPVIGCRVGGIPEVITHGIDGLLVEPNNSVELKSALIQLMQNASLRKELGDAGYKKVHEQLNYLSFANRMVEVFERLKGKKELCQTNLAQYLRNSPKSILWDKKISKQVGEWELKEASLGEKYLFSNKPGAKIETKLQGSGTLHIVALCHDWSGVMAVENAKREITFIDLYSEKQTKESVHSLKINGNRDDSSKLLTIRLFSEKNPASKCTEAWIKDILWCPTSSD